MGVLNDRKRALLSKIIEEHVNTAKPVSSKMLVEKYELNWSSATVRNDMRELEELGFIGQPYTSAGRVPTEQGYRYYVQHDLNKERMLSAKPKEELDQLVQAVEHIEPETFIKLLAKGLAELSSEAVLVGFNPDRFYYTGLSNIFHQPEFSNTEIIYVFSELVDHLDEVMAEITKQCAQQINILVGQDNPISRECSAIVGHYTMPEQSGQLGTIAILGPLRMDYQLNYQLIRYVQKLLNN